MNKRLECTVNGILIMFLQVLTINPLSLSCQPCSSEEVQFYTDLGFGATSLNCIFYMPVSPPESSFVFFQADHLNFWELCRLVYY